MTNSPPHRPVRIHIAPGGQGGREVGEWEAAILREAAGSTREADRAPGGDRADSADRSGGLAADDEVRLVDRPEEADLILLTDLFFDHRFWRVLLRPSVLRRLDRTYLYCEKGLVSRILPGLFTSLPRRPWDFGRFRAAWYTCHERGPFRNPFTEPVGRGSDGPEAGAAGSLGRAPDLLYSYVGRSSHPVRRRLLRDLPPRPDTLVEASDEYDHWDADAGDPGAARERERIQRRYAETIARSHFVLCPRGWSPSSIRVYEVMRMGRVPVILSDAWRRPLGPDWEAFAVFVPEREVTSIPGRLEALLPRAPEMGRLARRAWEEHFSPEAEARTLLRALLDLHRRKRVSEWVFAPLWPLHLVAISLRYLGYRLGGKLRRRGTG